MIAQRMLRIRPALGRFVDNWHVREWVPTHIIGDRVNELEAYPDPADFEARSMAESAQVMVSVSGVRGIVGDGLTPELALAFASALARHVSGRPIVVSRDSRPSGPMLQHAVLAGLTASGSAVIDIGIAPTPTCGRAVRFHSAAGGIQITASHNPAPWNGLKLFGPDGAVLPATEGRTIQTLFEADDFPRVPWDLVGRVALETEAVADHAAAVCQLVESAAIRRGQARVLLDANHGAGGPLGQIVLDALGCQVLPIGAEPDGNFEHEPEPIPENLTGIGPRVSELRADVGFVLDPDADRLAIFDERGQFIGEELTLALAVQFRLGQQPGPIVANMSTSRAIDDLAHRFGVTCVRTAVGEANVVAGMRQCGAVIGGEGNGGVIDPRVGWVRDPFIGMGLILNLMAATGKKMSELVSALPHYEIVKAKFTVERSRLADKLEAVARNWPAAKLNRLDGLRLDWADRWLHVRASNTEPIVRAIAEAPRREDAERLCREGGEILCD
jgi:phosphomannomutase